MTTVREFHDNRASQKSIQCTPLLRDSHIKPALLPILRSLFHQGRYKNNIIPHEFKYEMAQ